MWTSHKGENTGAFREKKKKTYRFALLPCRKSDELVLRETLSAFFELDTNFTDFLRKAHHRALLTRRTDLGVNQIPAPLAPNGTAHFSLRWRVFIDARAQ